MVIVLAHITRYQSMSMPGSHHLARLGPCVSLALGVIWGGQAAAETPSPVHSLVARGDAQPLRVGDDSFYVEVGGLAGTRYEAFDAMVVDQEGSEYAPDAALNSQLRLRAELGLSLHKAVQITGRYEHDLYSGISGGESDLEGVGLPSEGQGDEQQLRKAYIDALVPGARIIAGYTTSHWGLGLLSNDGAHGWTPGSAYFGDPRGGDRVLRFGLGTGLPDDIFPIKVFVAYDQVQGDDILIGDDEAEQVVVAIRYGTSEGRLPTTIGAYAAFREQTAVDDQQTKVSAFDVFAQWGTEWAVDGSASTLDLDLAFEGVFITGETEWAPSSLRQTHDVRQAGGLARVGLTWGNLGLRTDLLYASGDQNFDDDQQNALKLDPNLEMGLILFRQLTAATTARAVVRASDPDLIGVPSEDLDRYPTRGSVSNAALVFPRLWWRPLSGFEVYGGPLVAFADVDVADPRNSRLSGGEPTNALGGKPGGYLGTELDVGLRYTADLGFTALMLGAEGGWFVPGAAFTQAQGGTPDAILGGRLIAQIRL